MIEFSNNSTSRTEVALHSELFDFYKEVLEYCQAPLDGDDRISVPRRDGVDDAVAWAALALYVKLWRLSTAVIQLAQVGQAYEAGILVRSMFETQLLLHFVLKRQVHPMENGKRKDHPQRPFGSSFRARMYIAHVSVRRFKWAESVIQTEGMKREIRKAELARLRQEARECEAAVGTFWGKRIQRDPAGMSMSALAETLGQKKIYESLYRHRSMSTHPNDLESFVGEELGSLYLRHTPQSELPQVLGESMWTLLSGAHAIGRRLGLMDLKAGEALIRRIDGVCQVARVRETNR